MPSPSSTFLGLAIFDVAQARLICHQALPNPFLSGPFMLHNTFAAYCGLVALDAVSRFFSLASSWLIENRGPRRFFLSLIQFVFNHGAPQFVVALLLYSVDATSASRGGFATMIAGLIAMATISVGPEAGAPILIHADPGHHIGATFGLHSHRQ